MLQEAEKTITISTEAAQAVQGIITEKNMPEHALRVYVAGSGCSGIQFGMALDDKIIDTDTTVEMEGVSAMVLKEGLEQSLLGMSFLGELYSYEFKGDTLIIRQ